MDGHVPPPALEHDGPARSPAQEPPAAAFDPVQPPVDHRSFDEAFLAAQREFEEIIRDGYNPGNAKQKAYHYATLPNVIASLRPTLHRHGIHYMQPTEMRDVAGQAMMVVATRLTFIKKNGKTEARESIFPVCKGYLPPQTIGLLLTYARRYALLSFLGVAPEEHDDDAASVAHVGEQPSEQDIDALRRAAAEPSTAPEVLADVREQLENHNDIDVLLSKVETEADLDAVLESAAWNALPRYQRAAFEDKIEIIREQIKEAGGKRTPPVSRRAFIAQHRAKIAAEQTETAPEAKEDGDAVFYADALKRLNRCKSTAQHDAWLGLLTDDIMRKLTPVQRDSLRAESKRKRDALNGGAGS